MSVVFLATSVLMLYNHWSTPADIAIVLGCALIGVAVIIAMTLYVVVRKIRTGAGRA